AEAALEPEPRLLERLRAADVPFVQARLDAMEAEALEADTRRDADGVAREALAPRRSVADEVAHVGVGVPRLQRADLDVPDVAPPRFLDDREQITVGALRHLTYEGLDRRLGLWHPARLEVARDLGIVEPADVRLGAVGERREAKADLRPLEFLTGRDEP